MLAQPFIKKPQEPPGTAEVSKEHPRNKAGFKNPVLKRYDTKLSSLNWQELEMPSSLNQIFFLRGCSFILLTRLKNKICNIHIECTTFYTVFNGTYENNSGQKFNFNLE